MPRLAALSIDLDEVPCYCAIHGLADPPEAARWAVYERAIPRYVSLLDRLGIRATFFVIGGDLSNPRAAKVAASLCAAGHELGNHTQDHDYAFSRLGEPALSEQIERASAAIEAATGARPSGFRAPGYTINDAVVAALARSDIAYDSSLFPCPAYYGAKAAALAAISLAGRRSHSILDDPRMLTAPADPYRLGTPYYRPGRGPLELPIGVTRELFGRLPFFGTSLSLGGPALARRLAHAIAGRPLVNLELHGLDLCCADQDDLGFLARYQHDLKVPISRRQAALESAIEALRARGYQFVRLVEAAQAFS
ncbi:MAG: polysaccharide deacetylase family protein [Myxococcales bacterium]|nr:polysaccharide deacetylase family protein [Myxococcales bacterium]